MGIFNKLLGSYKHILDEPADLQRKDLLRSPAMAMGIFTIGLDCDKLPGASGDFGTNSSNPIPVNGAVGETVYINNLRSRTGSRVFYHRIGSGDSPVSEHPIDIFQLLAIDGSQTATLHFAMYHPRRSSRTPSGFQRCSWGDLKDTERLLCKIDTLGLTVGLVEDFPFGLPCVIEQSAKEANIPPQMAKAIVNNIQQLLAKNRSQLIDALRVPNLVSVSKPPPPLQTNTQMPPPVAQIEPLETQPPAGIPFNVKMHDRSRFEFWCNPRPCQLNKIGKDRLTTLFAGGIVNPYGPTLTAVAADGELSAGMRLPILHLVLNPFSSECEVIGEATIGDSWEPIEDLSPFFVLPFGNCPTLLMPSLYLHPDQAVAFYARFLKRFSDGIEVLRKVRKFPGDPWKRVQEDVETISGLLKKDVTGQEIANATRRLSDDEAEELAGLLLDSDSLKEEIRAFLFAWNGAIEFQERKGSAVVAKDAFQLKDFLPLFSKLGLSCRLPKLGE